MNVSKKTAPSASPLEAETVRTANNKSGISLPQNQEVVKNGVDPKDFIKKLKRVSPGYYGLKGRELKAFYCFQGKDFGMAVILAFNWGFIKGQRAEKARAKRARVKKGAVA